MSDDNKDPGTEVAGTVVDSPSEGVGNVLEALRKRSFGAVAERFLEGTEKPKEVKVWASGPLGPPKNSVRLVQRANMLGTVKISDSTKRILVKETRLAKSEHYKVRRKKRRAKYLKCERAAKLRRDRWLQTSPEGLWMYYKALTKRKGFSWDISKEDFVEVMNTKAVVSGRPVYTHVFNLLRKDKSLQYTLDNIYIVDRYTLDILYI